MSEHAPTYNGRRAHSRPAEPAWISVAAALPDEGQTVLIAIPDGEEHSEPVWLGYLDEDGWRTAEGMPVRVSHWRDLPEPPVAA